MFVSRKDDMILLFLDNDAGHRQGQSTRTQVSRRASAIALKRIEEAGAALLKAARREMSAAHAHSLAPTNKCLAQMDNSPDGGGATKKRNLQ